VPARLERDHTKIHDFDGWVKLNDDAHPTMQPFKTEKRAKIAASGCTIIAAVGDLHSDLDGGLTRNQKEGLVRTRTTLFDR
jgi:hypothetical protein